MESTQWCYFYLTWIGLKDQFHLMIFESFASSSPPPIPKRKMPHKNENKEKRQAHNLFSHISFSLQRQTKEEKSLFYYLKSFIFHTERKKSKLKSNATNFKNLVILLSIHTQFLLEILRIIYRKKTYRKGFLQS